MSHILGHVSSQDFTIDLDKIADLYNLYLKNIKKRCQHCYRFSTCPVCIFQLKIKDDTPLCPYVVTEDSFKNYLSNIIALLEKDKSLFFKFNHFIFS